MMKRTLGVSLLAFALVAFAPNPAAAQCGGVGQVPCYSWSWCAWTGLFGECWGGLVAAPPWNGCNSSRLNNIGLVCAACGGAGQPTCNYTPACDPRHNAFGLCYKCGGNGEPVCWEGPPCDIGHRSILGICSYSGHSAEPTTNVSGLPSQQQTGQSVRGIADLHTHMFPNLAFGGVDFWGAPFDWGGIDEAMPWCDYTWKFAIKGLWDIPQLPGVLGYEVHGPKEFQWGTAPVSYWTDGEHTVDGTGGFAGWPKYNTYTHQQMYYTWVKRAYEGGVRLMVMLTLNSEPLCMSGKKRADWDCDDMKATDRQLQAAKDLEWAIDYLDDWRLNGSGWYRIAYSPAQARQIIREGKMAIVLGIEVDSLFNCKPGSDCSESYRRAQLKKYYDLGARHLFPIHHYDNAFGGSSLFLDKLNTGNAIVTGQHFSVWDCSAQGYSYNVLPDPAFEVLGILLGTNLPNPSYYSQFQADCNARGLTDKGRAFLQEAMDQKFIIDTDHMSRLMVDAALDFALSKNYPMVSSHSIFRDLPGSTGGHEFSVTDAEMAKFKAIGGMVTAISPKGKCGTSRDFKKTLDYAVSKMKTSADDAFPAVGFSTDFGGFAQATGPRFGADAVNCSSDESTRLVYPFTGPFGGLFDRQVTGGRVFDYNTDGMAHYGLMADFFADLKRVGMTDAELDPLYNSAEAYIRLWERIENRNLAAGPNVQASVAGTLGANGWYTSDVTVTWDVSAGAGGDAVASSTGCDLATISSDTAGTTLECTATGANGIATTRRVTIRRDATPPLVGAPVSTSAPGAWSRDSIRVTFGATDATSGLAVPASTDVVLTAEGANQEATATFKDQAGNESVARLGGLNLDRTPPRIVFRFSHLPQGAAAAVVEAERQKWHNRAVVLEVSAVDDVSGVPADGVVPTALALATEGAAVHGVATARDRAGNSVTAESFDVKIDLTAPTLTFGTASPAPNAAGWNNTNVSVPFTPADALSGVAGTSVPSPLGLTAEGAAVTGSITVMDMAGNTATFTSAPVRIDKTAPTLTFGAASPAPNAAGWNNTNVSVPFTPADALSGVAGTSVPSPLGFTAEGADLTASVTVTDVAGNTATFGSPIVRIDKTAPTLTFGAASPAPNAAGWNNSNVSVPFTPADALSGVAGTSSPSPLALTAEGAAVTGSITVTDAAGNTATFTSAPVRIDKTAPTLTFGSASPAPNAAGWNNSNVSVPFTPADALSGVAGTSGTSPLVLSAEGVSVTGAVTVTDVAGNTATFTSASVRIDKTAPTLTFGAAMPAPNAAGWNNTNVSVPFTPADALSGVAGTSIPSPLGLTAEGAAVTGTVTVTDVAGNTAAFTAAPVKIDKTAPLVICAANPTQLWPANNKFVPIAMTWTFTDGLSGPSSYSLQTLSTNEGTVGANVQGFSLGGIALTGALRAQREGGGTGRIYTLGYVGLDKAGNSAHCTTSVVVPHDQGKGTRTPRP